MQSSSLLPLVIITGLLDSFNPCAIAILLIFIGLIFTLHKDRKIAIMMCLSYIASVYIAYFLIGMGVLKVMIFFSIPHLVVRIGAAIVIIVGLINLKDFFFPNSPISTKITVNSRQIISKFAFKATIPASAVTGFLVGIFEFPCSGAIYLAVLSLLSVKTTFVKGIAYLSLYNLMFVLPLIIIFLFATNRLVVEKMLNFEEGHQRLMRLIMALIMLGLGISMLVWIV